MLGVLVKGDLDDGRGRARVNLFRHKHEIESGRTSSVGMEILGFDTMGNVITSDTPGRKTSVRHLPSAKETDNHFRQAILGRNRQAKRQNHYLF